MSRFLISGCDSGRILDSNHSLRVNTSKFMTGVACKVKTIVSDPDLLAMSLSNASVASLLTLVAGDLRAPTR